MQEIQIKLQHDPFYRRAFYDPTKYVAIAGGRRTGKTWEARNWILTSLLNDYGSSGLWFDTVQKNIDKYVQRYFYPVLRPLWDTLVRYDKQKQVLHFPNESYIDFASAEKPENAEGFGYKYNIVNEAGIILKTEQLWKNTLQPMTKDSRGVRFVGTPKGRGEFFKIYQLGVSGVEGYKSFTLSAWDSPFWDKEQLRIIQATTPTHIFQQEYEAKFIEGEGTVFLGLSNVVKPIPQLYKAEENRQYVMGVDLAKHTDFTVIKILDVITGDEIFTERFNQYEWPLQKRKIFEVWQAFNRPQVYLDSTGLGDPIYDDLNRTEMSGYINGYKLTNSTKKELIENLMVAISQQEIHVNNETTTVSELETFEYNISKSGTITYNAPEGLHDDCVIALALATWGLKTPSNNFSFVIG